jgi:2-methylcitrate dehydratase PrpD
MASLTKHLADFVFNLQFNEIPSKVTSFARLFFMDFIGCAARGNQTESSRSIAEFVATKPLKEGAPVIGTEMTANYDWSAFANGCAAHSIEFDDTYYPGILHTGSAVYAACLSEVFRSPIAVSGKRFIEAVVAGYEVGGRIAASQEKYAFSRGFHPTGTCNVFGCAAAASKIRGFYPERIIAALGIAGHYSAGLDSFMSEGAWTKRLHPGTAAFNGLNSVALAETGFKAESVILEDPSGFLNAYADKHDGKIILKDLGKGWVIGRNSIKPYPCCARIHSPVNALLDILRNEDVKRAQVASVNAEINTTDYESLHVADESDKYPLSEEESQFCVHYALAAALAENHLTLDEYTKNYIKEGEWKKYAELISVKPSREMDKLYPELWPARVTVILKDGAVYKKYIEHTVGGPENPFTWDDQRGKFNSLIAGIYSEQRGEEIVRQVKNLDKINDVAGMLGVLSRDLAQENWRRG